MELPENPTNAQLLDVSSNIGLSAMEYILKLNSIEQKSGLTSNIQSVRRADVIDNPNATSKLIITLDKNEGYYKSLLKKMQEIVADTYKPMNTGGIATLMPK